MHFAWSPWTFVIFLLIATLALFLAWRTARHILKAKISDPDQLRTHLFIPLLILIVIIALVQLLTVFIKK